MSVISCIRPHRIGDHAPNEAGLPRLCAPQSLPTHAARRIFRSASTGERVLQVRKRELSVATNYERQTGPSTDADLAPIRRGSDASGEWRLGTFNAAAHVSRCSSWKHGNYATVCCTFVLVQP